MNLSSQDHQSIINIEITKDVMDDCQPTMITSHNGNKKLTESAS